MKITIKDVVDLDGITKRRYVMKIGDYQINQQTDGIKHPHLSKEEFKKKALELYKQKTLSD